MSKIEKLRALFYEKPVRNDLTFDQVTTLARAYGCVIKAGSNHTLVVHQPSGTVIPIPRHGKTVKEAYIKQLRQLFDAIGALKEEEV